MATHSSTFVWEIPWTEEFLQESDTTERLHFDFSLSCIGEGNGNPLQCSCLENPRDGGAWWAAVYGVTQSRTLLKRLSSSSSRKTSFSWGKSSHVMIISSNRIYLKNRSKEQDRLFVCVHFPSCISVHLYTQDTARIFKVKAFHSISLATTLLWPS